MTNTELCLAVFLVVYFIGMTFTLWRLHHRPPQDQPAGGGDIYVLKWSEGNHDSYPSDIVDAAGHVVSRNEVTDLYIKIQCKR